MANAIVTGASSGIGREIARRLAQIGYGVVINYNKSVYQAINLEQELTSYGYNAIAVKADVGNCDEVKNMFSIAYSKLGKIDLLVNNAGVSAVKILTDYNDAEIDELIAVNLKGVINCSKEALQTMVSNKCGNIINISSMWGIVGASCETIYSMTKAGIIGFTKALAKEVGPSNIRVNCIAPGLIDTSMNCTIDKQSIQEIIEDTPLMRMGRSEDVAELVLFLASNSSSFITGQVISCNGGLVV